MKIRTVKKVIKEVMIKGRKTPLAKKVTISLILGTTKTTRNNDTH